MGEVLYGTAGWVFEDWYGTFYPVREQDDGPGALFTGVLADPPDPDIGLARRRPLTYYARFFDAVEVNSSFYRIPSSRTTLGWAEQTERGGGGRPFQFSFKLPMPFTHEGLLDGPEVSAFRDCLAPVQEQDRLAAVLAQFPGHFAWSPTASDRLRRIAAACVGLPLVVEVRHRSWTRPGAMDLLRELQVGLASIDQPQDGRSTLPPTDQVLLPRLAYVRLHGRNAKAWFDRRAQRDQKYDYLYGEGELDEWAGRIDRLSGLAERTIVIANNHFRGKAPANALELRARRGEAVRVPRALMKTYGRLERISASGWRP